MLQKIFVIGWLGFNGTLSTHISCLRKFKVD